MKLIQCGTDQGLKLFLKFGDGDGPNLCRVKNVDVSFTFRSNDIITINIDKKVVKNHKKINKKDYLKKNWAVKWT